MKMFKRFSLIIFLLYYITSTPITIKSNIYNKISLNTDITEIMFESKNKDYITIELIFSYPSKYFTTFNEYNAEIESNTLSEAKNTNQTDIIIKSELNLGKNKVVTKTKNSNANGVILAIFKKDNKDHKSQNEYVYIKYTLNDNYEKEKYWVKNTKINLQQENGFLFINFDGINQIDNEINLDNLKTDFDINIFDKATLESLFENIYAYIYENEKIEIKPLISRIMKFKGKTIKSDMFLKIESNLTDNKERILLINAKVNNNNTEESNIHYEYLTFQLNNENNNNSNINTNNNTNNNNTEENQEISDEEVEENRNKNKTFLFIFLGIFAAVIIITFIAIFIYIKFHEGQEDNTIEEDRDYSGIGGIINKNDNYEKEDDTTNDNFTGTET